MNNIKLNILILSEHLDIENKIKKQSVKSYNIKTSIVFEVDKIKDIDVLILDNFITDKVIAFANKLVKEQVHFIFMGNENDIKDVYKRLKDFTGHFSYLKVGYSEWELKVLIEGIEKDIYKNRRLDLKNAQIRAIIENLPYAAWIKDTESKYISANKVFKNEISNEIWDLEGRFDEEIFEEEVANAFRKNDLYVINNKKQLILEEILKQEDRYKIMHTYKYPVITGDGKIRGTVGTTIDVTKIKNYDFKLDIIMENMPFAIFLKDSKGKIIKGNSKFFEYYKSNRVKFRDNSGNSISEDEFLGEIEEEDRVVFKSKLDFTFERNLCIDGEKKIIEVHKSPILDIESNTIGILGIYIDITEIRTHNKKVEQLVYKDFLTKLDNRRSFYKYIDMLDTKKLENIGVMVIDLDKFKNINKIYGHASGDNALIFIGKELEKYCENAFISRSGGDEFIVIYEDISENFIKNKSIELIEKIDCKIKNIKEFSAIALNIGIAKSNKKINIDEVLARADFALYKAKKMGKNKVVFYDDIIHDERKFDLALENDLIKAFENDEIELYYQPQYSINKEIIGLEALFRWNNDKYKNIPVINLIKKIEEGNLIHKFGDYIIKKAIQFSNIINKCNKNKIVVYINISAVQIMESNFLENFKSILEELGGNPELIGIELTETVLLDDIDGNIDKLKKLKDLGVKIALDDFGTGYSSLNYLTKLPINKVKLDKSFVRKMNMGDKYINLVKLIVDICHSLGMEVVAEGVETNEELDILRKLSVEYIQGYLLSKPIPEYNIRSLLLA